jgi:hypothetical protein
MKIKKKNPFRSDFTGAVIGLFAGIVDVTFKFYGWMVFGPMLFFLSGSLAGRGLTYLHIIKSGKHIHRDPVRKRRYLDGATVTTYHSFEEVPHGTDNGKGTVEAGPPKSKGEQDLSGVQEG